MPDAIQLSIILSFIGELTLQRAAHIVHVARALFQYSSSPAPFCFPATLKHADKCS